MKILIVGTGGREHALAQTLLRTAAEETEVLFCSETAIPLLLPGSRTVLGDPVSVAQRERVDLVLIGPEKYLVEGLVDQLSELGIKAFGPPREVARLEGSKSFAKSFMDRYGVRTPRAELLDDFEMGREFLSSAPYPLVLKADGLAAGKGVKVCETEAEAAAFLKSLMLDQVFGESGRTVLAEEFLRGFEASVLAFCDGNSVSIFPVAQDYKRVGEGDAGPNTGGMGCIAPHPDLGPDCADKALWQDFQTQILDPTLSGIRAEQWRFSGVIFFGVLVSGRRCYLLEYNMRFGDPEAQTLLPLLESPLGEVLDACARGRLEQTVPRWSRQSSCTVVLAAAGYPEAPRLGESVDGLKPGMEAPGTYLAGVSYRPETGFTTAGGRALGQNALGETPEKARAEAYRRLQGYRFPGSFYRRDIGLAGYKE